MYCPEHKKHYDYDDKTRGCPDCEALKTMPVRFETSSDGGSGGAPLDEQLSESGHIEANEAGIDHEAPKDKPIPKGP